MQLSFSYLQQFIVGDSNIYVDISSDYDGQKGFGGSPFYGFTFWHQHITQPSQFHFSEYLLYSASRGVSKQSP